LAIQARQFLLKRLIQQFVPVLTQKHKQFGEAQSFSQSALLALKARLVAAKVTVACSFSSQVRFS